MVSRGAMSQRGRSGLGNLPVELTSFVGRGRELAEVKRLLPVTRVVTLTGPGGIGKSRLALRAAHKLGRNFPQGVWPAELAGLDSPDLLPYALARSLGLHERPDGGIQDALLAYLRERRLLLVLDNCEHLLEACRELVSAVVSGCPGVRIVCTSRERLCIPALTDDNGEAASDICRRLDGLPLAIELAAVRLSSMTADDLRERLDDRFRLLTPQQRVWPVRGRALRATVDWSHELLGEQERILWRRLSVLVGDFSLPRRRLCARARDWNARGLSI